MQNFQHLKIVKYTNASKGILFLIISLILTTTVLHGQESNAPNSVDINNLSQIQNLSKVVRDSLAIVFMGMKTIPVKYTFNGIDQKQPSGFKQISQAMNNLIISILENPEPEKMEASQQKINKLMKELNLKIEDLGYEIERQAIISEYKSNSYSDRSEKREARKDMKENLRELKQDRKEQKEALKQGTS